MPIEIKAEACEDTSSKSQQNRNRHSTLEEDNNTSIIEKEDIINSSTAFN